MNNKSYLNQINELLLKEITIKTFNEVNLIRNNEIIIILDSNNFYKFFEAIGVIDDKLVKIEMSKHSGMFTDSILLKDYSKDLYDLRYYPKPNGIEFYYIDTNTKKIYIKNIGKIPLKISSPMEYTEEHSITCEPNSILEIIVNNECTTNELKGIWG